jgi:uncharacterized protein (TIGR00725 family)
MKKLISVIGSDNSDANLSIHALNVAEQLGRLIGEKNLILVCGGRGGIMEAVCKGVKNKKGITVGILPNNKKEANNYVDIPIISGMGNRRNAIIAYTSDVIIAIAGRWGTLNEISFSMIFNKPVILIKGTGGIVDKLCEEELNDMNYKNNLYIVNSPEKAIEKVFELI